MKGYKVFNPDWTCRNFQYEVGKTYKMGASPNVCKKGFHFCEKAVDCFKYYDFDSHNHVAEVEAIGEISKSDDDSKCCTNKIKIIRELLWHEVLDLVNTGNSCTGIHNSGDRNSGNHNGGSFNSGDWNKSDHNSGCFMTIEPKIMMFNKPTDWTYEDWFTSDAKGIMDDIPTNTLEWISVGKMTNTEKEEHPEYETTCGYLKKVDNSGAAQEWWDKLSENTKNKILSLPNFDPKIFYECTGIKVEDH